MKEIAAIVSSYGPAIGVIASVVGLAHFVAKWVKTRQERHTAIIKLLAEMKDQIGRIWYLYVSQDVRDGMRSAPYLQREYEAVAEDLKELRLLDRHDYHSFWAPRTAI